MSRIKRSVNARKKRRKVLEQAEGYRATKNSSYKRAKEQVQRSGQYAYRDRRVRKREFRKLWIIRINAGARENGLSYNQFMHGLQLAQVELDRKILAELAVSDPKYFASLVDQARAALELSLIHISEPTRLGMISYAVFCLKKKKKKKKKNRCIL